MSRDTHDNYEMIYFHWYVFLAAYDLPHFQVELKCFVC